MEPFDSIEKLINERGSAAILRERLSLAADHYAALEKQITTLQEQITDLETEKENLQLQLEQSQSENQRLVEQSKKTADNSSDRIDEENRILVFLGNRQGSTDQEVAQHLGASVEVARYYLVELDRSKLVFVQLYINQPSRWRLAQQGRGYLIQRGLLR